MNQYKTDISLGRIDPEVSHKKAEKSFMEQAEYDLTNQDWLRESFIIGVQILNALEQKGWTQTRFAKELGVSRAAVGGYLTGRHNFTLALRHKLQNALGVQLGLHVVNQAQKGDIGIAA